MEGEAIQWGTPQAHPRAQSPKAKHHGVELANQVEQWQTPATDSFRSRGGDHKDEMGLDQQARHWATPQARDHMPAHTPERITAMKAEGHGMRNLNDEAAHWPTPQASDDQRKATKASHQRMLCNVTPHWSPDCPSPPDQVIRAGQPSSPERRVLNPRFVEWLMGWPIGWTSFGPVETALSHWLPLMRGRLSTLCTPPRADQPSLF